MVPQSRMPISPEDPQDILARVEASSDSGCEGVVSAISDIEDGINFRIFFI